MHAKSTILYIPTADRPDVLTPSVGGGTVPTWRFAEDRKSVKPCPVCASAVTWFRPPTDQMDACWICPKDWQHRFKQEDVIVRAWQPRGEHNDPRALLLSLDGVPDAIGVGRARELLGEVESLHVEAGVLHAASPAELAWMLCESIGGALIVEEVPHADR